MPLARAVAVVAAVLFALLAATDVVVRMAFPHAERLSGNFSAAYLARELAAIRDDPATAVFFGDSALWGYKVDASSTSVSLLRRGGCDCRNVSFEGGSPANTYALLRLLVTAGARPRVVVFNVNQKELNPADSAYRKLHPSVEQLAWPVLSPPERALLAPLPVPDWNGTLDRAVSRAWALYAFRSDLREAMFGNVDAVHAFQDVLQSWTGAKARAEEAHRPTADRFEGTYDLTPLVGEPDNVSLTFLRKIGELVQAHRLRAYAVLTPTNHRLLHDYIDVPAYRQNLRYTAALLTHYGVRVVDADAVVPSDEFIDNDHLTVGGNRRLADILRTEIIER